MLKVDPNVEVLARLATPSMLFCRKSLLPNHQSIGLQNPTTQAFNRSQAAHASVQSHYGVKHCIFVRRIELLSLKMVKPLERVDFEAANAEGKHSNLPHRAKSDAILLEWEKDSTIPGASQSTFGGRQTAPAAYTTSATVGGPRAPPPTSTTGKLPLRNVPGTLAFNTRNANVINTT